MFFSSNLQSLDLISDKKLFPSDPLFLGNTPFHLVCLLLLICFLYNTQIESQLLYQHLCEVQNEDIVLLYRGPLVECLDVFHLGFP